MVTRRFLRLALLGLLAFMIFCLVVMELTLHRSQWVRIYHQISPSFTGRISGRHHPTPTTSITNTTTNTTASHIASSAPVLKAVVKMEASSRPGSPGAGFKPINVVGGSLNSTLTIIQRRPDISLVNVTRPSTNTSRPSNGSSLVDHCQKAGIRSTADGGGGGGGGGNFSLKIQKLPDGSRPQNCSHCFYSRFTPLLQSCRVCNTHPGGGAGGGVEVELMMMILTTHGAVEKRNAIRKTWASVTRGNTAHVRHVFVLGRSKNEEHMQLARKEQEEFGDVIMYDFIDTYANLTLKTLTSMHWVVDFCHNARFVLKADDDMWINVPTLLARAKEQQSVLNTAIGGACRLSAGPIRNRHSKWYASEKDYPQKSYPGFCSGTAYVTSLNVARHVISVSPDVPFFYLEDVYMALCIKKLGPPFHLHRVGGFFHGNASPCGLRGKGVVSVHEVSPRVLMRIWNAKCW